jgi:predicted DNA-binding protein
MAVSVRMDPGLEHELESAAKRQGITKSQFIVDAVERALGRKDPYRLLMDIHREYGLSAGASKHVARAPAAPQYQGPTLRDKLKTKHDASMSDWLAYQQARKSGHTWQPDDGKKAGS